MAAPSQKYRQIGFYLDGGGGNAVQFDLAIRPEDLTVSEPSRLVVQQTLGGAWADSFGRGLVTISLAGTLGWRGNPFLSGEAAFQQLRQTVLLDWHQRREDAASQGTDPAAVELTFIDTLDDVAYIVAPQSFTLRRSKSSPLLMRYQVRLLAMDDADAPGGVLDQIASALSNPLRWLAGLAGLGGTLATLQGYLSQGMSLYGKLSGAVAGFIGTGMGLLGAITDVASRARGIFAGADAQLLGIGRAFFQAGANAFSALQPDASLPAYLLLPAVRLSSLCVDADCTLANSFSLGRGFASYDDLFGASTCSSTGGGDPISPYAAAGTNPFDDLFPRDASPVLVSGAAATSMAILRADPLKLLGQDAMIGQQLATISAGVTFPGKPLGLTP